MSRFMRIMVLFDLPVLTKEQRRTASRFRNFLLKDGYYMMQYSVYARVCNGPDAVEVHKERLKKEVPPHGAVRMIVVTEKQYSAIELLVGSPVLGDSPRQTQQLLEL